VVTARLCIVAAAVLWSTSGLFAKSPLFAEWSQDVRGPLLSFWRATFAGLFLLPLVRRARWRPALVPMSLCFAAMNVTYLSAMARTTAANAIWLQSTAPAWVFLLGVAVLGERVSRRDWLMLDCGLAGVAVILACELGHTNPAGPMGSGQGGVLLALASGVCYAGVVLSLRGLRAENGAWLVAVNQVVSAVATAPYVLSLGIWPTAGQLLALALFGVAQMGLPYLLFARGLRTVSSHEAAGLALLEPLLVPVWTFAVWGEETPWWTLAGGGLILAGLASRYGWPRMPRRPADA
jgi:drug/metabolite transporter (DMT)-like permease